MQAPIPRVEVPNLTVAKEGISRTGRFAAHRCTARTVTETEQERGLHLSDKIAMIDTTR